MRYQEGARVRPFRLALLTLAASLLVSACTSSDNGDAVDGRVRIAASTALIAEFATIVAGDRGEVTTLIPAGVDLHSYEPAPATVAAISEADIVFVNGYNLEEGLLDVILENVPEEAEVVAVAAGLTPIEGEVSEGDVIRASGDPHFWLDASNAIHYVQQIRDHLAALDPGQAAGYHERAETYIAELNALDTELSAAVSAIPEGARELAVLHDAYRYLAAAYGFELSAALLPAGAQQSASAIAVVELIELIEEREITAIYREPQFGSSVLDSVADETGVRVLVLYSTYADEVDSYVELMRANAAALLEGLGG